MAFELISRALRGTTRPPLPDPGPVRRAAVALVFRDSPGRWPQLLMIKRADAPGDPWSGHMAFPGGRVEQDENDAQAAIRESEEELGLRLEGAHRLGTLRPVIGPRLRKDKPTVHVQPFVFWVQGSPPLRPNHEVAEVHWFGLHRFLQDEGRATFPFSWKGSQLKLPCHRLDGRVIWGMSLSMIDDLVDRIRRAEQA